MPTTTTINDSFSTGTLTNVAVDGNGHLALTSSVPPATSASMGAATNNYAVGYGFMSTPIKIGASNVTITGYEQYMAPSTTAGAHKIAIIDLGTALNGNTTTNYNVVYASANFTPSGTTAGWYGMAAGSFSVTLTAGHYYIMGIADAGGYSEAFYYDAPGTADPSLGTWGTANHGEFQISMSSSAYTSLTTGSTVKFSEYSTAGQYHYYQRFWTGGGSTSVLASSGTRVSPAIDISTSTQRESTSISWTQNMPQYTTVDVAVSVDGGNTFTSASNGGSIPGVITNTTSVILKETLTQTNGTSPTLNSVTLTINSKVATTVTPQAPTQSGSTVTIPTQTGVVYQNHANGATLTGTQTIASGTTLVVDAVPASDPDIQYTLTGTTQWPFTFTKTQVTVATQDPTRGTTSTLINTITLPTVTGVVYQVQDPGTSTWTTASGNYGLSSNTSAATSVRAIAATDPNTQYNLTGNTSWSYWYAVHTQTTSTQSVPFTTTRIADDTMYTGDETVVTPGQNGVETVTNDVYTANGTVILTVQASDTVTTQPVTEVVHYGTMTRPVTATDPVRTDNTITIPNVAGVQYIDMTGGTKAPPAPEALDGSTFTTMDATTPAPVGTAVTLAPGTYNIVNSAALITAQAQTGYELTNPTTSWQYTKYASIVPQKPDEYDHYIVIPTVDGIEYYDGATGVVYPAGTQRQIGASLTIHTRLTVDNAILTNDAASWTFTRSGGVTAIKPESIDTWSFKIPFNDQLQYINADTGEVLTNNSGDHYDLHLAPTPTGLLNVTAKPIAPNFLNNPYDVWTWGQFDHGLQFVVDLDELDITTNTLTPVRVSDQLHGHLSDYLEVYVNGNLITDYQSPAIYGDNLVMELKLKKDTGLNRLAVDWQRGSQNQPTGYYWTNWDDQHYTSDPSPQFEWTSDDTIKTAPFSWLQQNPFVSLYVPLREIDKKTYGKHTLTVQSILSVNQYLDSTLDPEVFSSGHTALWAMDLQPGRGDWEPYFDLLIDGVKQVPSAFTDHSSFNGSSEVADYWATMDIPSGYHEFRLMLKNPDLTWNDSMNAHPTGLYLNGPDGFKALFDADANGDLVWSGVWPDSVQSGVLLIFPYEPNQAIIDLLPKTDPTVDAATGIVTIPDPYPGIVEYVDIQTGNVIPPGPFQLTRFTEIADRIVWESRFKKVNGQYYIYQIDHDYRFWRYEYSILSGVFYVTAKPPTQSGTVVTIPKDDNVLYWDTISRQYLAPGPIDFIDLEAAYNQTEMRIKPIPRWATYRLTNPNDVWVYTSNLDVYSITPTQVDNDITIPAVNGVQYINKADGTVLTGTVHITADITIDAQALAPYNLKSLTNEWTFQHVVIQAKWVTALDPTTNGNWVTIPVVEGINYIDTVTGIVLTGTIYVKTPITIGVKAVSDRYAIFNATATWSYTNTPVAGEKEIVIVDPDSRLVVYVNNVQVTGNVFTVTVGSPVSIDLGLLQDSEFGGTPYLLASDSTQTPFTLVSSNRAATLDNVTFADNTSVELHVGAITQLTKPIYFTGDHTSLQIKQGGTLITTMASGSTSKLTIGASYDFQVIPDTGYDFDRPGTYTYNGSTLAITATLGQAVVFSITDVQTEVYVDMNAVLLTVPSPTSTSSSGFNNVYVASYDDLKLISKEMLTKRRQFVLNNPNAGMSYFAQVETNPQEFIINTISVPFAVPTEDIGSRERIMLGYTQLYTSADRLSNTLIRLDLGQIYTAPKYNNSYDYANTMVNLHLPYAEPITIDASYAIGQTISLEYYVDAYTGYATINVRSSLVNNNIIYSLHVLVANDVPFISMKNGSVQGGVESIRSKLLNNTPTPFLEVLRNVPYQIDSPFNNVIQDNVTNLNGITGFVEFSNVYLNLTDATADEESQLRNILAAGIHIK